MDLSAIILSSTSDSFIAKNTSLKPCAVALWTFVIISASPWPFAKAIFFIDSASPSALSIADCFSPSASRIIDSFFASALSIADCFSPSAWSIAAALFPSAWSIDSLLSLSALICFSIVTCISWGGIIFFNSTLLTFIPHLSVASSSITLIFVFIISLDVKVSSKSSSPIIFLSVVAVKFSIAVIGLAISNVYLTGSVIL